jgi:hypothetical protein
MAGANVDASAAAAAFHPDGRPITPADSTKDARARQAARDAALACAAEAEREAAAAQADRDAADARLRAALGRAARERAAADLSPPPDADDDDASFTTVDNEPLYDAVAQHEATALLNLHTQAVSVHNIRALIPLQLDSASTFYARWRESFLLTLGRYSLERHVLSDIAIPTSAD